MLFASPVAATNAVWPFATRAPVAVGVPVKAVPTGSSSTCNRSESAASGSVTTPRSTTVA
ncbi:MAG: hypothetical protein DMD67_01740 [Gemmatimonadetes bacterium]|nr:MAG: hypothetical protein DMD67_01740 [Gemmatimonadota bacterium]